MRTSRDFIKDGLMLTVTSLILRSAGVFFSARLSAVAGNSVMGLYTQIMNIYAFAITASAAGVNLGAVRIVSECIGGGELSKVRCALKACISYCIRAGLLVALIMFFCAPLFGNVLIGDSRSVISLRALAFALPFISISNAFHGFFNGIKKISASAFTSLFEQFVRISATLGALTLFANADTEMLCLVLVICNAASEAFSCLILFFFYILQRKNYPPCNASRQALSKRFLGITLPIAASALVRSALTTTEHLLIPIGLKKTGLDADGAFAQYGIVSGMVLPILLYPMALLSSFASITIAELSARCSAGEGKEKIRKTVTKGLSFAIIFGIGCACLIGTFSSRLGMAIYKSSEAGVFLKVLAPLVFFMYLDHISDGMLKGLDKQNYVMKVNILDASLSVLFAIILVPRLGIYGFIASLYLCECLNCFFSFGRLFLMIKPDVSVFASFTMPACCAFIAVYAVGLVPNLPLIPLMLIAIAVYILLLGITGSLKVYTHSAYAQ